MLNDASNIPGEQNNCDIRPDGECFLFGVTGLMVSAGCIVTNNPIPAGTQLNY